MCTDVKYTCQCLCSCNLSRTIIGRVHCRRQISMNFTLELNCCRRCRRWNVNEYRHRNGKIKGKKAWTNRECVNQTRLAFHAFLFPLPCWLPIVEVDAPRTAWMRVFRARKKKANKNSLPCFRRSAQRIWKQALLLRSQFN